MLKLENIFHQVNERYSKQTKYYYLIFLIFELLKIEKRGASNLYEFNINSIHAFNHAS